MSVQALHSHPFLAQDANAHLEDLGADRFDLGCDVRVLIRRPQCFELPLHHHEHLALQVIQRVYQETNPGERAVIVQIASRSFLEHGYKATSMSAIAAAMGGSKGTLWSYFNSKEELLAAVIDSATAVFNSFMASVLNTDQDIRVVLTKFCETFIERISRPEAIALQRLVIGQVDRFPEIGRLFMDHAPAINYATLSAFFKRQMAARVLRDEDPDDAARMLLDLCTGGYHDLVLYGVEAQNSGSERRQVTRVVEQFLRCYAPAGS